MDDPAIVKAAIRELESLKHELSDLSNPNKPPLGPPDFMRNYISGLKRRIADIEKELEELDDRESA